MQRAALGEIGNSLAPVNVPAQDLKKPKTNVREYAAEPPQIIVKDEDVRMEEDQEMQEEVRVFPPGVLDIDALEDQNNPQLCVEYAPSIYTYLRQVEDGLSIRKDFLSG